MVTEETVASPLDAICKETDWTLARLAGAAGCPLPHAYNARNGYTPIPRKLVKFLENAGYDSMALREDQDHFIASRRQAEAEELRTRRSGQPQTVAAR